MIIPAAREEKEEVPTGFFFKIKKSLKEDPHSRPITLYLGLCLILFFLVVASLAPQIGRKLGLISQRQEEQKAFAGEEGKQMGPKAQILKEEKPKGSASKAERLFYTRSAPQKGKGQPPQKPQESAKTQTVLGNVTAANTQVPISGAEVVVKNQYFETKTTTDELGNYQMSEIPAGKYAIEIQKSGFKNEKKPLVLPTGQIINISFSLTL